VYQFPVEASWQIDLWGQARAPRVDCRHRTLRAATLDTLRLTAQAELAQDYFQLRALDTQKQLLDDTVIGYQKSLQLTKNRYASGVASRADVAAAETLLRSTEAQAIDVGVLRAQTEHAIAILIGKPPAMLSLAPAPLAALPPPIPLGIPSTLLERRPDVAAAERTCKQ
jgi:outer membrane protein TolC